MTKPGKLCSGTYVPLTSKGACHAAAKGLGKVFRGTVPKFGSYNDFAFAQKGCLLCDTFTCKHTGVWWNPTGMDKQGDVEYKEASAICSI